MRSRGKFPFKCNRCGSEHLTTDNHHSIREEKLVKITFDLSNDGGPVRTESLWAEPLGKGLCRLRNVPFFAYGFSDRDIVNVVESDGQLWVKSVGERGGHSTYRIYLPDESTEEKFTRIWIPFEQLGCTYERANRVLVAIDVPPTSDVDAVYAVLEKGEESGVWTFEEGHCGHPLRPDSQNPD